MPEDEDRPRDASSAADPGWADAVAPDDISELARDIQAYHRECRAVRRRDILHRIYARPSAAPLTLIVAVLAAAAVVATLMTVMTPRSNRPSPLPIASHPSALVGQVGGLVPNLTLKDLSDKSVLVRDLRATSIALIPLDCNCRPTLSSIAAQTSANRLRTTVVAPSTSDAEAATLAGRIDGATPDVYYDPQGLLAIDYKASGVTVVLLNRDGTVFRVLRDVTASTSKQLGPALQQMLRGTGS